MVTTKPGRVATVISCVTYVFCCLGVVVITMHVTGPGCITAVITSGVTKAGLVATVTAISVTKLGIVTVAITGGFTSGITGPGFITGVITSSVAGGIKRARLGHHCAHRRFAGWVSRSWLPPIRRMSATTGTTKPRVVTRCSLVTS